MAYLESLEVQQQMVYELMVKRSYSYEQAVTIVKDILSDKGFKDKDGNYI